MGLNLKIIARLLGAVSVIIACLMIPALAVSVIYEEYSLTEDFGALIVILAAAGLLIFFAARNAVRNIRIRDGIIIVSLCWIFTGLLGALPYVVSGIIPSFADAFFESVSGFTTTGITVLGHIGAIPKSLLFWRSLTNWIGGIGILIFAISILPALGIGAVNLFSAENSGGASAMERIRSRISDNAKQIYIMYIVMTAAAFVLLLASNRMSLLDAIVYSFSSVSNSGVVAAEGGVTGYGSLYVEAVVALFCVLASMNFVSYTLLFHRRFKDFIKEPEVRYYLLIIASIFVLTMISLWANGSYNGPGATLRNSFFTVFAFVSTAGFGGADYGAWPLFCKCLLFAAMFIGGCSASTSGGMKVIRLSLMASLIRRNIYKRLHPNAVVAVKLGDQAISAQKVSNTTVFVLMYLFIFAGGTILLSLDGQSAATTASAALAAMSNIGLGFGELTTGDYHIFSVGGRLLLSLLMLVGRLELFTIILLIIPNFWRPDHK